MGCTGKWVRQDARFSCQARGAVQGGVKVECVSACSLSAGIESELECGLHNGQLQAVEAERKPTSPLEAAGSSAAWNPLLIFMASLKNVHQ